MLHRMRVLRNRGTMMSCADDLSHVVGLQQLLDRQAVAASFVVHEPGVRHQTVLLFGLGGRRFVFHRDHGDGGWRRLGRLAGISSWWLGGGRGQLHALDRLVVGGQSRHDRVAGQRIVIALTRVLFVSPSPSCGHRKENDTHCLLRTYLVHSDILHYTRMLRQCQTRTLFGRLRVMPGPTLYTVSCRVVYYLISLNRNFYLFYCCSHGIHLIL